MTDSTSEISCINQDDKAESRDNSDKSEHSDESNSSDCSDTNTSAKSDALEVIETNECENNNPVSIKVVDTETKNDENRVVRTQSNLKKNDLRVLRKRVPELIVETAGYVSGLVSVLKEPMPSDEIPEAEVLADPPNVASEAEVAIPTVNQEAETVAIPEPEIEREYCKEMYYKLRRIFPNIDSAYIKQLCPRDWDSRDREAQLTDLVEHILTDCENIPKVGETPKDYRMDDVNYHTINIHEKLVDIFPDADPDYLREIAERNYTNPNSLNDFIETNLERRDYPTREEYKIKCEMREKMKRYTTDFNVKDFLSIISDPHSHFTDCHRKTKHQPFALEFLKTRFENLPVCLLRIHCLNAKEWKSKFETMQCRKSDS